MAFWNTLGKGLLSAIPVVGPIASSIIGSKQSQRNVADTIRANKELAEYQYSKDLEMWNRQNLYNTPEAQMERFKAAGLNPNLIYGRGSGGEATSSPKYQAPRVDYSGRKAIGGDIPAILSSYQSFKKNTAQMDNLKALTDLTNEKVNTEAVKRHGMHYDNAVKHKDADMAYEIQKYSRNFAELELKNQQQRLERQLNENTIKSMEIDWYEWMKGSAVGAKALPLLKMLMGR